MTQDVVSLFSGQDASFETRKSGIVLFVMIISFGSVDEFPGQTRLPKTCKQTRHPLSSVFNPDKQDFEFVDVDVVYFEEY